MSFAVVMLKFYMLKNLLEHKFPSVSRCGSRDEDRLPPFNVRTEVAEWFGIGRVRSGNRTHYIRLYSLGYTDTFEANV